MTYSLASTATSVDTEREGYRKRAEMATAQDLIDEARKITNELATQWITIMHRDRLEKRYDIVKAEMLKRMTD